MTEYLSREESEFFLKVERRVCQNTLAEALRTGHKPAPRRSAGVQPEVVGNRRFRRQAARRRGTMNS